jgi:hypothetical protein
VHALGANTHGLDRLQHLLRRFLLPRDGKHLRWHRSVDQFQGTTICVVTNLVVKVYDSLDRHEQVELHQEAPLYVVSTGEWRHVGIADMTNT